MISAISSYKIEEGIELKDLLCSVCKECAEFNIWAVDIYIDPSDISYDCLEVFYKKEQPDLLSINWVLNNLSEESAINGMRENAKSLILNIEEAVSIGAIRMRVPALATNDSNISNLNRNHYKEWANAVFYLATSLVVAHKTGVKVVEIVCGNRVYTDLYGLDQIQSQELYVSKDFENQCQEHVIRALVGAFILAYRVLNQDQWPDVAFAFEIEPDLLALLNNTEDALKLLKKIKSYLTSDEYDLDIAKRLQEEKRSDFKSLKRHFGLNCDFAHLLIQQDREKLEEEGKLFGNLEEIKKHILHFHASDHYQGGHFVDAPIASFHQEYLYRKFINIFQELISGATETSPFFSGAIAIELEGCNDIDLVLQSKVKLEKLLRGAEIHSEQEATLDVANRIAKLKTTSGWGEGINSSILNALEKLDRITKKPKSSEKGNALLTPELLTLYQSFLCTRKYDERTFYANRIARKLFLKLGMPIFVTLFGKLADVEWDRAFHDGYRDHTIHSIYVFLLGLYLYTESEAIFKMLSDNTPEPRERHERPMLGEPNSFWNQWVLATLCHDLGYPFESEDAKIRRDVRHSYNNAVGQFLKKSERILRNIEDGDEDNFCFSEAYDEKTIKSLEKLYYPGNMFYLPKILANYTEEKSEEIDGDRRILTSIYLPEYKWDRECLLPCSHISSLFKKEIRDKIASFTCAKIEKPCNPEQDKGNSKVDTKCDDFMRIFDFFRTVSPDAKKRARFLDHGMMSAVILAQLIELHREWVGFLEDIDQTDKKDLHIVGILQSNRHNYDIDNYQEVLFAIATHNIRRELKDLNPLYEEETSKNQGMQFLTQLDFTQLPSVGKLLILCDSIQEWHRHGFVNPLKSERLALSPRDVNVKKKKDKLVFTFTYIKDNVDGSKKLVEELTNSLERCQFWEWKWAEGEKNSKNTFFEFKAEEEIE